MIIHLYSIQHILTRAFYVLLIHSFCQRFQITTIIENQQFALIWSYHRIYHSYYHLLQCCLTFCECFHTFHHHRKPVLMNVFSEITLPTFLQAFYILTSLIFYNTARYFGQLVSRGVIFQIIVGIFTAPNNL